MGLGIKNGHHKGCDRRSMYHRVGWHWVLMISRGVGQVSLSSRGVGQDT